MRYGSEWAWAIQATILWGAADAFRPAAATTTNWVAAPPWLV
jgi:hypothetical protein